MADRINERGELTLRTLAVTFGVSGGFDRAALDVRCGPVPGPGSRGRDR